MFRKAISQNRLLLVVGEDNLVTHRYVASCHDGYVVLYLHINKYIIN